MSQEHNTNKNTKTTKKRKRERGEECDCENCTNPEYSDFECMNKNKKKKKKEATPQKEPKVKQQTLTQMGFVEKREPTPKIKKVKKVQALKFPKTYVGTFVSYMQGH